MKENPKKRGRKAGVPLFVGVSLEELNRVLKPNATIPVSAKFLAVLSLVAAPAAIEDLTPEVTGATVEIKEENWD